MPKSIAIKLFSNEPIADTHTALVEVPDDGTAEELEQLSGNWLHRLLDALGFASNWAIAHYIDMHLQEQIRALSVEGDHPVHLRFVRGSDGELYLDYDHFERRRQIVPNEFDTESDGETIVSESFRWKKEGF